MIKIRFEGWYTEEEEEEEKKTGKGKEYRFIYFNLDVKRSKIQV